MLHSTKLTPSDWIAVAGMEELAPPQIAAAIGVSRVTSRKIAAVMEPAHDGSRSERLRHMMSPRHRRQPAPDPWQLDPLPATLRAEDSPLGSLSDGAKAILNALRARPFGATAAKLAELAGVSYSQTLRCLARLEQRGWAKAAKTSIHYGYELRRATVWSLSWSDGCMHALSYLRDRPTRPLEQIPDRVPRRFWRNFWSGASADTLTISQHGLHIAETLIGGHDVSARAWALSNLPTPVLRECRTLRGFETGLNAELLDLEIARRAAAA